MITGMAVMGCQNSSEAQSGAQELEAGEDVAPPVPAVKRDGPTTSSDPNLHKKVDAIVAEVLGKTKEGFWYKYSGLRLGTELKSNPPVKYPVIPISFGNSCVGIFDHATLLTSMETLGPERFVVIEHAHPDEVPAAKAFLDQTAAKLGLRVF